MTRQVAIIIGAGPAGLTAAYELLHRTAIQPIVFELSDEVGGLARTIDYKGNRIDFGGHRFFSRSDRVMMWWLNILPLQATDSSTLSITYRQETRAVAGRIEGPDPEREDRVMLIRKRVSRIYFAGKLFNYPVRLSLDTLAKLGVIRTLRIGVSYLRRIVNPITPENNLEQFFINRFGEELYRTFFKSYTEKVWGIPCDQLSADWGRQRIKGLSVTKTILHALRGRLPGRANAAQTSVETSLIEQFLYPKYGPGQMWQEVARIVKEKGGEIHHHHRVIGLQDDGKRITSVTVQDLSTGTQYTVTGDYFFSTMPVKELVHALGLSVPESVRRVAEGLPYRDFLIVGLLLKRLRIRNGAKAVSAYSLIPDTWIYVHEPGVKLGRIQIFNNWSPYLVKNPRTVWLGLEYFCTEGDELWRKEDTELRRFAAEEAARIGILDSADILDSTVMRIAKAYPAYFGTYNHFEEIRQFTDGFENLFLIGRNGMHKYNNQDHSMLAAMTAVDNIIRGERGKDNLWTVNAEQEYLEEK